MLGIFYLKQATFSLHKCGRRNSIMAKKDKNQKQIEEKMTELENQLKRALADYQNLERRVSEGRSELTKLGIGDFILRIVPSLNHLEQALEGAREAGEEGS